MTTTAIAPPPEYPLSGGWEENQHGSYFVPEPLRAEYAAAPATPEMFASVPRAVGVEPNYVAWAHRHRLAKARQNLANAERVRQFQAGKPWCPVCGRQRDARSLVRVRTGEWSWNVTTGEAPVTTPACITCAPVLEAALLSRQHAQDGRTIAEAAAARAAEVLGSSGAPSPSAA